MKVIPVTVHGVLDYLSAGTLYALPRIFNWSKPVTNVMTGAAIGTAIYSLMTRYQFGVVKVFPMRTHLLFDALSGLFFLSAPVLFREEDSDVTRVLAGIGVFELTAALTTNPDGADD